MRQNLAISCVLFSIGSIYAFTLVLHIAWMITPSLGHDDIDPVRSASYLVVAQVATRQVHEVLTRVAQPPGGMGHFCVHPWYRRMSRSGTDTVHGIAQVWYRSRTSAVQQSSKLIFRQLNQYVRFIKINDI